jgi:hypothetical protein
MPKEQTVYVTLAVTLEMDGEQASAMTVDDVQHAFLEWLGDDDNVILPDTISNTTGWLVDRITLYNASLDEPTT